MTVSGRQPRKTPLEFPLTIAIGTPDLAPLVYGGRGRDRPEIVYRIDAT